MLPTEIQRIILLIGLAATGYLMILAWNEDFGASAQRIERNDAPLAAGASDLPVVTSPSAATGLASSDGDASDSDLPDASLIAGGTTAANQSEAAPAASVDVDRLIRVSSPTLQLWIDPIGGDIVRARLPEHPVSLEQPDVPIQILDRSVGREYVAQSVLLGETNSYFGGSRPRFSVSVDALEVTEAGQSLSLTADLGNATLLKTFTFDPATYLVNVQHRLTNNSSETVSARLLAQLKRDRHEPEGSSSFTLGPQPYLGAAVTTDTERYQKVEFDDLDDAPFTDAFNDTESDGWVAMLQHYFVSAWVAQPEQPISLFGQERNNTYVVGFTAPWLRVGPGESAEFPVRFYVGPKDQDKLETIAPNLNLTVDYGFLWWLAVPLFKIMSWVHDNIAPNWGVSIILLTVFVKILLFPLFQMSFKSMANMRRVAPEMKRLQERYSDDRQKLSSEMMNLYKREKVNPLGGCLPMLLPMPIFLALYWVLFESVELRQAPFFLWIQDLSVLDPFFVLPLIMGGSMYVQQLMAPAMGDPMQQRMMRLMPVFFTVLFLFFPAGLVLYWVVNNLLSLLQQWMVNRSMGLNNGKAAGKA